MVAKPDSPSFPRLIETKLFPLGPAIPRKHLPFLGVRFLTSNKIKKVSYVSLFEFQMVGVTILRQPNTGKLIDTAD